MGRYLLVCLLALAAACAQAGTGTTKIGTTTVFYPAADDNATPVRGNNRLVVFSHGSGGSHRVHSDLAKQFVQAGFLVAMPEHEGDNWHDMSKVGPPSWKQRPLEISRAIDAMEADARFSPLFDHARVGMWGMSAGGHTALTLAGGRWSPSQLRDHCEKHLEEDFASCVGLATRLNGNVFDGLKKTVAMMVIRSRLDDAQWYSHHDPRITAIVAEVPFSVDFDLASLAQPKAKLGIVQLRKDIWLKPQFHSLRVLDACQPRCELVLDHPDAGHGSLLSPPPPQLPEPAATLLADPAGFDRAEVPKAHARIVEWLKGQLF